MQLLKYKVYLSVLLFKKIIKKLDKIHWGHFETLMDI